MSRLSVGVAVTWMTRSLITCSRTFLAGPEAGVTTTPSAVFSKPASNARAEVEAVRARAKARAIGLWKARILGSPVWFLDVFWDVFWDIFSRWPA